VTTLAAIAVGLVAAAAGRPPANPYEAGLAYAACMRAHGVPHPDPDRKVRAEGPAGGEDRRDRRRGQGARLMLRAAIVLLLALAVAPLARPAPQRTVPCSEIIGDTEFPGRTSGYRTVLGAVSVPPAYLAQIVPNDEPRWPWWRKAGLVVRANGQPVTITVPSGWRDKVAIEWGYGNMGGPFSSLRIAGCGSDPSRGNAYAGGFVVRAPSCVPLTFHVGGRSATVRFGLGRRC
jgi:hypothetical protein